MILFETNSMPNLSVEFFLKADGTSGSKATSLLTYFLSTSITNSVDEIFTEINKQIYSELINKLKIGQKLTNDELNIDPQILDRINKFAPIKNILKNKPNNNYEIIELFEDIRRDLMNYDLEHRIQELESKFSKDLSEATFNELKELKKKQNIN